MLPTYQGGPARNVPEWKRPLEEQIETEKQIAQAIESAPSIYSDKVSARAREAWEEKFFLNCEAHRHFRVRDQAEVCSTRPGRSLHIVQFIHMLNTLPRRRFILNDFSIRRMRGFSVSRGGAKPFYVMALDDGIIPEWSLIELDGHGLVRRLAARGWRAVLLTLLDMGLITENEMRDRFGFPTGESGVLFRKYCFEHRNRRFSTTEAWKEQIRLTPSEVCND